MISLHDLPNRDKIELMTYKELFSNELRNMISIYESEWLDNIQESNEDYRDDLSDVKKDKVDLKQSILDLFDNVRYLDKKKKDEVFIYVRSLTKRQVSDLDEFRNVLEYINSSYIKIFKILYSDTPKGLNAFYSFIKNYLIYVSSGVDSSTKLIIRDIYSNSNNESSPYSPMNCNYLKNVVKRCFNINKEIADNGKKYLLTLLYGEDHEDKNIRILDLCNNDDELAYNVDDLDTNNYDTNTYSDVYDESVLFGDKIIPEGISIGECLSSVNKTHMLIEESLDNPFNIKEDHLGFIIKSKVPHLMIYNESGCDHIINIDNVNYLLYEKENELCGLDIGIGHRNMLEIKNDPNGYFEFKKDNIKVLK